MDLRRAELPAHEYWALAPGTTGPTLPDARRPGRGVTKVLSSLVFHQVPLEEKRAGLAAMRKRFRLVQKGDGFDNTEPNAQGVLPELMAEVGFDHVEETQVFETVSGSMSIYRALVR